jgi:integrase
MLPIPENVLDPFNKVFKQRAVVESLCVRDRKRLRYFLDFSRNHSPPEAKSEQVRLFIEKLTSKGQTPRQCTRAAHAIPLFFESQKVPTCPRPVAPAPARLDHPFDLVAASGSAEIAVTQANLTKRVKSHTFRHGFATHLLQANYGIRTIQTMLGHSDVRTMMMYTRCVPSKTAKEAKRPLDFLTRWHCLEKGRIYHLLLSISTQPWVLAGPFRPANNLLGSKRR